MLACSFSLTCQDIILDQMISDQAVALTARKPPPFAAGFYFTKDFFFLFFLLSLFAPLNGIQQLEDISDTQ